MAEKRMFAKSVIDSDIFLDMPLSTQALYFHLSMRADDDGFINNPKKIQRMIGCSDDDMRILCAKSFIIPFESGVVVIKHWKIHNYIQKDRYKETIYLEEKSSLKENKNKEYERVQDPCTQNVYNMDTQIRLDKIRLDKVSVEGNAPQPKAITSTHQFNPPSLEEVKSYCSERKNGIDAERFIDFYASKGWLIGKTKMKDWKAAIRTWERRDKEHAPKQSNFPDYSNDLPDFLGR